MMAYQLVVNPNIPTVENRHFVHAANVGNLSVALQRFHLNGANVCSPQFAGMYDPNASFAMQQPMFAPNNAVQYAPAPTGTNAGYCAIGGNLGIPHVMPPPATLQTVPRINYVTNAAVAKPVQFANGVPINHSHMSGLSGVPVIHGSHPGAFQGIPVYAPNCVYNAGGYNANAGVATDPESDSTEVANDPDSSVSGVAMYRYKESSRNLEGTFQEEPFVTILDGDFLELRGMEFVETIVTKKTHDVIVVKDIHRGGKLVLKRFFKKQMKNGYLSTWCHDFHQEAGAMQRLSHPNIIQMIEAVNCPKYWAIVLPYYKAGNLHERCSNIDPTQVPRYIKQLCSAVSYLHEQRIVHGDIKDDNVYLTDDDNIILADFGHAAQLPRSHDLVTRWWGTPAYQAPEKVLKQFPASGKKMDVYALGMTFFCILTAHITDFGDKERNRFLFDDLKTFRGRSKYVAAVRKMWSQDPSERPGMPEVLGIVHRDHKQSLVL